MGPTSKGRGGTGEEEMSEEERGGR